MRNLLALLGLAVVTFFGLGWYLGWYTLAVEAGTDGKKKVHLDVDTKKIGEDAKKGLEKVEQFREEKPKPSPETAAPPAGQEPKERSLFISLPGNK